MRILPELSMPDEPVRPELPWSLDHLRIGFIATAVLAAIGVAIAAPLAGWRAVWGVLLGLAIVALFFAFGAWAVAKLGEHDDRRTLPAALGSYFIKITLLGVLLMVMPTDGPVDVQAMAWAVVAGTLTWVGVQVWAVWRKQLFYVDYRPPAQIPDDSAPRTPAATDPNKQGPA